MTREPHDATPPDEVIALAEETARIDVRSRVTGRVRVSTRTEVTTEDVAARLATHAVEVERVPVGRDLGPDDAVPVAREEGGVTIIPVLEEVLVVEKRLRLVEEVHLRRVTTEEDVSVPVELRRQVAEVARETVPPAQGEPA